MRKFPMLLMECDNSQIHTLGKLRAEANRVALMRQHLEFDSACYANACVQLTCELYVCDARLWPGVLLQMTND